MRRATVVVMDACGVGALPDAAAYGDAGSNTLVHLAAEVGGLQLPTLGRLGLGSIVPCWVCRRPPIPACTAGYGRSGPARSRRPGTGS